MKVVEPVADMPANGPATPDVTVTEAPAQPLRRRRSASRTQAAAEVPPAPPAPDPEPLAETPAEPAVRRGSVRRARRTAAPGEIAAPAPVVQPEHTNGAVKHDTAADVEESDDAVPAVSQPPLVAAPLADVSFDDLGISAETLRAIREMGFTQPTEIQAKTIPLLLDARDVIGQAQTGTGKTAAFGVPLVEGLDQSRMHTQALILAPTRELALQISDQLRKIVKYQRGVRVATLYGGSGYGRQFEDLKAGGQIVVGTPGRVLDHIMRGSLKLDKVDYVVLDEADRMLDMGFLPDVERILRRTPRARQTSLFSATLPNVIRILSRRHMYKPVTVQVRANEATVDEIAQVYYEVAERDKLEGLLSLIKEDEPERAMIFRQMKVGVDRLVPSLRRHGLQAEALHGDLTQGARERVLQDFRDGRLKYLVATDVAARGLDIPEVSHVFNYDVPEDPDAYVHRIGRTARAGRSGTAITFVGEWDLDKLAPIHKKMGDKLERRILPLYQQR